jgi:hypothetical protein
MKFELMNLVCLSRLDIGEGREINLEGKCSRSKLLSQCIKYLGPVSIQQNTDQRPNYEFNIGWLTCHSYILCSKKERTMKL